MKNLFLNLGGKIGNVKITKDPVDGWVIEKLSVDGGGDFDPASGLGFATAGDALNWLVEFSTNDRNLT